MYMAMWPNSSVQAMASSPSWSSVAPTARKSMPWRARSAMAVSLSAGLMKSATISSQPASSAKALAPLTKLS